MSKTYRFKVSIGGGYGYSGEQTFPDDATEGEIKEEILEGIFYTKYIIERMDAGHEDEVYRESH